MSVGVAAGLRHTGVHASRSTEPGQATKVPRACDSSGGPALACSSARGRRSSRSAGSSLPVDGRQGHLQLLAELCHQGNGASRRPRRACPTWGAFAEPGGRATFTSALPRRQLGLPKPGGPVRRGRKRQRSHRTGARAAVHVKSAHRGGEVEVTLVPCLATPRCCILDGRTRQGPDVDLPAGARGPSEAPRPGTRSVPGLSVQ